MTYIDRTMEIIESALREILLHMEKCTTLTFAEPFTAALQNGKEATIVAIEKKSETEVLFVTTDSTIPIMRIDAQALLDLVEKVIEQKAFTCA